MTQNSNFLPRSFLGEKSQEVLKQKKTNKAIKVKAILAIYERVSWTLLSKKIASRTIAPEDNCPEQLSPGWLSPDYCSQITTLKIIPPDNILWKLPSRKIAFRMICRLHNCLSDKLSRGKLPPRKKVPRINYAEIFLPQEPEILVL